LRAQPTGVVLPKAAQFLSIAAEDPFKKMTASLVSGSNPCFAFKGDELNQRKDSRINKRQHRRADARRMLRVFESD
jgi:hypothetical protein